MGKIGFILINLALLIYIIFGPEPVTDNRIDPIYGNDRLAQIEEGGLENLTLNTPETQQARLEWLKKGPYIRDGIANTDDEYIFVIVEDGWQRSKYNVEFQRVAYAYCLHKYGYLPGGDVSFIAYDEHGNINHDQSQSWVILP